MSALLPATTLPLVVFALEERRFAVDVACVERVLRMVAITPFPRAPEIVLGAFDYRGRLIPVMDVRRRFRLPRRDPTPEDQLLVLRSMRRWVAFAVDAVEPAITVAPRNVGAPHAIVPGLDYVRGIVQVPGEGIVIVHDIDLFLSLDEERQINAAMEAAGR